MMVMTSSPNTIPKNRPIVFINGKLRRFYSYFQIDASYGVEDFEYTTRRLPWKHIELIIDDKKYTAKNFGLSFGKKRYIYTFTGVKKCPKY